jgi:serine-type D-Ala-D-Ala carboxypeptidase/endopeptidase (penicillin-binding protein 4)
MRKFIPFLVCLLISLSSHAQISRDQYVKLESALGETSFFGSHLTGFVLYDLDSQLVMYEKNSQINFTPASTTKLFTLFASWMILKDSTQTIRYVTEGKTLKIWGSGDPSWKYKNLFQPDFQEFLAPYKKIIFSDANLKSPAFGYGWQWDDYYYAYSAERSSLPIYGNLIQVKKIDNKPEVSPLLFQKSIQKTSQPIKELRRDFHSNNLTYNPATFSGVEKQIPFLTSPQLFVELAASATGKKWIYMPDTLPEVHQLWRGSPLLPLLKESMLESDNFIAEQLLFMISDKLFKEIDTERTIDYILKTYLNDLPDRPKWVDGSGLSRHNLFTPRSMIGLFEKLYQTIPLPELISLLPTGGKTGTLKNSYQAAEPFVFAKTGTLSNHQSLIGLVKTKNGKLYAFAFMNSNYPYSTSVVRKEMEKVIVMVRDGF